LLVLTVVASATTSRLTDYVLQRRMPNILLRQVAVRAAMVPVALIGIYLVLRISGLTQMAMTVVGGTGLIGLIIGIAFQNIVENFLASVLISTQRPFEAGDLVEVSGYQGYVQRVTTRGTVLLTLDGNHVQIPNSIIYKSIIRNFTANPNTRLDFRIPLDYGQATSKAQEVAMHVLNEHPAVLKNPEPAALVEEFADAKVYLRIYFWINIKEHSSLKVRSAIMRLVKKSLHEADLSITANSPAPSAPSNTTWGAESEGSSATESGRMSVQAEGSLTSERKEIQEQAVHSRQVERGPDLLGHAANGKA
jgi:small conductance mechanosensitive channel